MATAATIDSPVLRTIGRRIAVRRMALGLSQGRVAARVGVTHQTVAKWERANVRLYVDQLLSLTSVLDVPLSYFTDGLAS